MSEQPSFLYCISDGGTDEGRSSGTFDHVQENDVGEGGEKFETEA